MCQRCDGQQYQRMELVRTIPQDVNHGKVFVYRCPECHKELKVGVPYEFSPYRLRH